MKAALRNSYGPPESLLVRDIDKPVPGDKELLVKVFAVTVNRTDCAVLTGKPFIMRFFTGLLKPSIPVTGTDFAGVVEEVGKDVKAFRPGDHVRGFIDTGSGSHASYMKINENKPVDIVPGNISFEQAAASLEGAHYAYYFIKNLNIKAGVKVLVNGGTGAIGSSIIQFAKYFGADITATCRGIHSELVKSLGADRVIDYTREDFTAGSNKYDIIFDAVGKSTFGKCRHLLNEGGIYISSEPGTGLQNIFLALFTPLFRRKKVIFPFPTDIKASMKFTADLIIKGKYISVIDKTYRLEEITDAFRYTASGQKAGNVIIAVNSN